MTLAAFAILQCATNVSIQALPLFIGRDLGGDVRDAGLILGLCAGLEIPLMLGLGALSVRMPLRRLLLIGALCEVAYLVLATSASVTWQLAVGQVLNASAVAAIQGLGVSYVQDMLPGRPGRASTLFTNTFPAGAVFVGPIVGAAAHFGYRWAYAAGVALTVLGLALLVAGRPARIRSDLPAVD
jgi:SET family sugar efflux transporter-like MFS transporter